MRIIRFDRRSGELRVQVETLDDLWHISRLIEKGDRILGVGYRREERRTEDEKRGEKKRVTLLLHVEKVEFHPFSRRLRVSGRIVEGAESRGKFHTLNLEAGDVITLIKDEWRRSHFKRLDDAKTSIMSAPAFVSLDYDEATVARVHEYGVEIIAEISSKRPGKSSSDMDSEGYREMYFEEIWRALAGSGMSSGEVVIVGPGFEKELLSSYLIKKGVKVHVEYASQGGLPGINELLRRGAGNKLIRELRIARETETVEKLFEGIAKDDLVAYGWDEVMKSLQMGGVSLLLIHEDKLYDPEIDSMLELAEKTHAHLQVISAHHNAGKRFASIGGVAAFLRFRVTQ